MANLHCSWRGNLQKLEKAGRHSPGNNLCILGLELNFFFNSLSCCLKESLRTNCVVDTVLWEESGVRFRSKVDFYHCPKKEYF